MKRIAEEIVSYLVVIFAMLGFLVLMYVIADVTSRWKILGLSVYVSFFVLWWLFSRIYDYYHEESR